MIKNKKGLSLREAFPAVLTVAIVAILLVTVLYLFSSLSTIQGNITRTVVNESITPTTLGTTVSNASACGFGNLAISKVYNASTGTVINSGNYSVINNNQIRNLTKEYIDKPWNVTYTYTDNGAVCESSASLTTNFVNQIPLVGLVLTIVLIAIVIGVLVSSFFSKEKGRI
jgi:hypothetical protein